jgi:hypothetical protein
MTDGYTEEDLRECCAVDCGEAGKHLLILKEWTGTQYGGKTETGTLFPVIGAYYCRNHLAKKLELLAKRYVSNDDYNETEKDMPPPQYDGDTPL